MSIYHNAFAVNPLEVHQRLSRSGENGLYQDVTCSWVDFWRRPCKTLVPNEPATSLTFWNIINGKFWERGVSGEEALRIAEEELERHIQNLQSNGCRIIMVVGGEIYHTGKAVKGVHPFHKRNALVISDNGFALINGNVLQTSMPVKS